MIRVVLYLVAVAGVAAGLGWLADRPGSLLVTWQGYEVETSVFRAVVLMALALALGVFLWSLLRQILTSPAMLGRYFSRRRQEKGLDALSSGLIAIGAGDRNLATRYAVQARRALPNEPLTHLLRAQAAQLSGDRATSRRIFEAMLGAPETEQLGLRGLYLEADREGEAVAARQFAERALRINPKLGWAVEALFDMQCRDGDWDGALETLAAARKSGHFDKAAADRRRAVLLTAQAQAVEELNGNKALQLATEAHGLAPELIPAAAIAARQQASRGATAKAAKIIERTWKHAPHPDLALVYAFARPGDSPRDRLERIKRLSRMAPHSPEGPIALATAAIEAHEWEMARSALAPLVDGELTQRVCTLMARVEGGENNDAGRVREWLARAVNAPRDPAWTADGIVVAHWVPTSPTTGALDVCQWIVPPETERESEAGRALKQIEELAMLGSHEHDDQPRAAAADRFVPKPYYGPPSSARPASPAPADQPAGSEAGALRTRSVEADRPITVEARPVPDDDFKPASTTTAAQPDGASAAVLQPRKPEPATATATATAAVEPVAPAAAAAKPVAPKPADPKPAEAVAATAGRDAGL